MALSQTDLDALDLAIAAGQLTVRLGDRVLTYQSISEMLKARAHVAKVISNAGGVTRVAPRYQTAVFDDA